MLRFSRILFGTYNPFRLCTTAFAAGTAAFAARVASCPFVLAEVKEPNSPLLTITSSSSTSDIFSRCVQWQLDANLSLVHQLLREFDASVCRLMELLASQTQFLRCYTPESDPELDEAMIKNRSDWILTLKRLDKLELAIESGISLLRTSVETTFMCEDLVNGNLNIEPSHAPGQRLSCQGSEMLQSVESEYRRLKGLRTITTNRWSVLISEHIANWGQLAKHPSNEQALLHQYMDFVSDTNAVLSAVSAAVLSLANFRSQSIKEIADHDLFTPNSDLYDSVWCDQDKIISLIENVNRLFANWKDDIKKTVKQTLTTLKEAEAEFAHASPNEKSRFCYLYGKALNALPQDLMDEAEGEKGNGWTSQAIQWLTRALKFNPQCADAWCELGESCWRQGNADEAVRHFRQTLKLVPNHVDALCELSMALRQIPASETNSTGSVGSDESPLSESVRLAHEAVRHEPTNGRAWTVLGNALLTMFFESFAPVTPPPMSSRTAAKHTSDEPSATTTQSASQLIMSRCIAAYALAIKDKSAVLEQSLHYNRGVAWHYQDKFADSLRSWLRAMCLDPEWSAPRINAVRLTQFLIHAYHAVEQIKSKSLDDQDTTGSTQSRETGKSTQVAVTSIGMPHLPDLVTPLLPCLSLLNDGNQSTCTDDSSSSEMKRLSNNQCSSISQLLGPYFTSLKCDLAAGLSGASLKKNKANRSKHFKCLRNAQVPGSSHLQFSLFNDLKIGSNRDKLCVGRVVCRLPSDTELALNLLLVDAHSTPLSVRLYNIGKDLGPDRKDILAIPHPFMEQCDVKLCLLRAMLMATSSFGEKDPQVDTLLDKLDGLKTSADDQLSFRVLRIPIPDVLVVNGQPVGASWTAAPVLKNIFFTAV